MSNALEDIERDMITFRTVYLRFCDIPEYELVSIVLMASLIAGQAS